ncbi:hypothetical protein MNBD_GAMMA10-444 [hydrothermal vent metagenome]|uniref:DUF4124 domain-containing protein n=1 Tax=hydrothermal vent metagenome TaxID=652676 RepID=A0A3B0XPD2_9ZZZZ
MSKFILLSAILHSLLLGSAAHAGMARWVDEKGQVHYSDRVPSEYLHKEHSELNEQGVVVHTTGALPTSEERSKADKQKAVNLKIERERMIVARRQELRDRVLLDTFTTERDLEIARNARIEALDSQISLAQTLITNDQKKLEGIKKRIKQIRDSTREPPANLLKSETSVSRQLVNNLTYIDDKNRERAEIFRIFEEDVQRFRELKKTRLDARKK